MHRCAPARALPAFAACLLAATAVACSPAHPAGEVTGPTSVVGEGPVTSEDRAAGEFHHVSVSDGLQVEIALGSPAVVTVSAQANLLPLITTVVDGDQLAVNVAPPGISSSRPITVRVTVPQLSSIALSGGAQGTLDAMATTLAVDVSGGARLDATGRARTLTLAASSGAQVRMSGLLADAATVTLSGGARAELAVVAEVSGTATEGAVLKLAQQPKTVSVQTSLGAIIEGS
jgi:hypothetical protein